jgi:acyl dehydratase
MSNAFLDQATLIPKGRLFEDFHVGQKFNHHWGRTINEGDNSLFTTLTLSFNPLYFNKEYAAAHDHSSIVVNPLLVFNTVFGLTVEDLSEAGGPFLGVNKLSYLVTVYPGDTLCAKSETIDCRVSNSNPANGIVTWRTEGFNQRDERVIEFERTNLVRKRNA